MKRKSKKRIISIYQPTRLFIDDLEQIYSAMCETMHKVSIETDDYEFENIQELAELKTPKLTNLKMVGYKDNWPYFFFFMYPNSIHIRVEKDETELLGTMEKVKEIISVHKRPLLPASRASQILFSFLPLIAIVVAIIYAFVSKSQDAFYYTLFGVSIFLNIPVWIFNLSPKNQAILSDSKNASSFWKRNSDTIWVAIITTILTLIIAYFFGKIFTTPP
jgi:hypothetical protein